MELSNKKEYNTDIWGNMNKLKNMMLNKEDLHKEYILHDGICKKL